MEKIRTAHVDRFTLMRTALKSALEGAEDSGIEISLSVATGKEFLEKFEKGRFDVVLIRLGQVGMDGFGLVSALTALDAGLKIIILSDVMEMENLRRSIDMKCRGYVSGDTSVEELIRAIHVVHKGGTCFDSDAMVLLLNSDENEGRLLSRYDLEFIRQMLKSTTRKDLGRRMNLSERSISYQKVRLREKLGVHSDLAVIAYAIRHGLV